MSAQFLLETASSLAQDQCCDSLMPQGTRAWDGAGAQASCRSLEYTRNDAGEGGNLSLLQTELSGHQMPSGNWGERIEGNSTWAWEAAGRVELAALQSSPHLRHSLPLRHRDRINTGGYGKVKANPCCWKPGRAGLSWVQVVGNNPAPGCPELLE